LTGNRDLKIISLLQELGQSFRSILEIVHVLFVGHSRRLHCVY
jgi:hypothetical protein